MKSQYYHEVQIGTYPKKPKNINEAKMKKINDSAVHNAQTHSRHFRSEKRDLKNSLQMMQRSKQESEYQKLKQSYPRPIIPIDTDIDKMGVQWIDLKCLQCENLKLQHSKRIKELQMIYEQELTEQKERYILMEKKYLLKENQLIQSLANYERLQRICSEVESENVELKTNNDLLQSNLRKLEQDLEKVKLENKNNLQKIETLHRFLKLYLEQTKIIINWAHLFQQIQEDLPTIMRAIKQDLLQRKFDCEVTLKQAATFQKINFSEISINKDEASAFMDDDSGCETFMKYLKQESISSKSRPMTLHTSTKKGSSFIDSLNNKENIDFLNGVSIKSLLNSRVNESKYRQKPEPMNDDCLRLLLIQAKALEASRDYRGDSIKKSNSRTVIQDFSEQKSLVV